MLFVVCWLLFAVWCAVVLLCVCMVLFVIRRVVVRCLLCCSLCGVVRLLCVVRCGFVRCWLFVVCCVLFAGLKCRLFVVLLFCDRGVCRSNVLLNWCVVLSFVL